MYFIVSAMSLFSFDETAHYPFCHPNGDEVWLSFQQCDLRSQPSQSDDRNLMISW